MSVLNNLKNEAEKGFGKFVDWLKTDEPGAISIPQGLVEEISDRTTLSNILYIKDIDKDGFILVDDGKEVRLGFMVEYTPFLMVGTDAELQINNILTSIGVKDTVVQFGVLSHPFISPMLDEWSSAKQSSGDPMIDEMAKFRKAYFLSSAYVTNLIAGQESHPKDHSYLITVTVPYKGEMDNEHKWTEFKDLVTQMRTSLLGVLDGAKLPAIALEEFAVRFYLRILLNPHLPADELKKIPMPNGGISDLVMKNNKITSERNGTILFREDDSDNGRKKAAACLTMDGYPKYNSLPLTAKLIGDIIATQENIPFPFWLYINVRILDSGKVKDELSVKLGSVTRQLVSDSPSYRAIMSHLFDQRDEIQNLIRMAEEGSSLVTSYLGLNVFADPDQVVNAAKNISSVWAGHGFRGSMETFIHFPIWFSSLPGQFFPSADPTNFTGLQRSSTMTNKHASYLAPVQGDWKGTPPNEGGLLLTSRRLQPATFNIMNKQVVTNYNFTVVAASGMGKSFVAQEIVSDFLSKGGLAYVIDAGRSYYEMCELLGGTNLVFQPDKPLDINPFSMIKTELDLQEFTQLLQELIGYMAWPQTAGEAKIPDWEYTLLEHAIEECWNKKKDKTILADIRQWLYEHGDERARDIADQLRPYTEGRFGKWFDGTGKKIDMDNRFIVIELDDLKSQGTFRDVILTMMMQRIANAMYKCKDPSQPKLMLIDEGWDLLASNQASGFINRAYRTYRKFGGSAGVITQSFGDFQMSAAAKAAWDNSAWLFALGQKAESLNAAFNDGLLTADETVQKLMRGVHTIPGKYSEIFVRCDGGFGVYRFITDRYTYWLYTSNGAEKAERNKRYERIKEENPDLTYQEAMSRAIAELADEDYKRTLGKPPRKILQEYGVSP